MFGLFGKKAHQPTVTPEDKDWIERNIVWFIEAFGMNELKKQPFILPTSENFPYKDLKDDIQFQRLFEQLCEHWGLDSNEIEVKFFDDLKSKQWITWVPQGKFGDVLGTYSQIYGAGEKRFRIQLAKSNLNNPQLLVSVLAHELAHTKLLGGNLLDRNSRDMEALTDLACIYFGFGVFVANSVETKDIYWMSRSGYLPNEIISYTNALICYITGKDAGIYTPFMNDNTVNLFRKDYQFLIATKDTILSKDKVLECEQTYKIGKRISEGFNSRNFDEVIDASKVLVEKDPKNYVVLNSIGYARLLQKKYSEAISEFTKSIDINPYWDYPYNNRGYCKLQLGDFENAFLDIQSALDMNPENSFAWRNMGAYYLATAEFDKALQHFEEAEKIDPKTELINFYLGYVYLKLGNSEKSGFYFEKSKKSGEYNDSVLD